MPGKYDAAFNKLQPPATGALHPVQHVSGLTSRRVPHRTSYDAHPGPLPSPAATHRCAQSAQNLPPRPSPGLPAARCSHPTIPAPAVAPGARAAAADALNLRLLPPVPGPPNGRSRGPSPPRTCVCVSAAACACMWRLASGAAVGWAGVGWTHLARMRARCSLLQVPKPQTPVRDGAGQAAAAGCMLRPSGAPETREPACPGSRCQIAFYILGGGSTIHTHTRRQPGRRSASSTEHFNGGGVARRHTIAYHLPRPEQLASGPGLGRPDKRAGSGLSRTERFSNFRGVVRVRHRALGDSALDGGSRAAVAATRARITHSVRHTDSWCPASLENLTGEEAPRSLCMTVRALLTRVGKYLRRARPRSCDRTPAASTSRAQQQRHVSHAAPLHPALELLEYIRTSRRRWSPACPPRAPRGARLAARGIY